WGQFATHAQVPLIRMAVKFAVKFTVRGTRRSPGRGSGAGGIISVKETLPAPTVPETGRGPTTFPTGLVHTLPARGFGFGFLRTARQLPPRFAPACVSSRNRSCSSSHSRLVRRMRPSGAVPAQLPVRFGGSVVVVVVVVSRWPPAAIATPPATAAP